MRTVKAQRLRLCFILTLLLCGALGPYGWGKSQGEISLYSFRYLGMTVARGAITISDTLTEDGRPAQRIEARATSVPLTSFLFRVRNRYTTVLDTETGYPLLYEKEIEQSNLCEKVLIRFDQVHRRIYGNDERGVPLTEPTHCFISALYLLMNHTFQPEETVSFPVYAAGTLWEVRAKALRAEKVVTPAGTYPTVLVEIAFHRSVPPRGPKMRTDVLTSRMVSEEKKTSLWFSTGRNRIMVKGQYELFPTRLQMILTEHHR